MLPAISEETLFLRPGETQKAFLSRVRSRLARSLDAGFPPILSIRRHVKRGDRWVTIQGHFVTITSVPGNIVGTDDSFPVGYVDPWGGNFREGTIAINNRAFMSGDPARNPNLQAVFPTAVVGKRLVRSGEESVLAVSAVLGIF